MPARILSSYYEFSKDMPLACQCGWHGPAGDAFMEAHREVLDWSCPECEQMLLVASYPTTEQMKTAARSGSKAAIEDCRMYGVKFEE